MLKRALLAGIFLAALALFPVTATAQWTIHAIAGTLKVDNVQSGTIILDTDDGSSEEFQIPQLSKIKMNFDKDVRADTTTPDKFTGTNSHVILFFYGDEVVRSAVAIENVGAGPFEKLTGWVMGYDKHSRTLTLKTDSGEKTFAITDKTIVDGADGVVPGRKFNAERGDHVRLLAQPNGKDTQILLVRFDGNAT